MGGPGLTTLSDWKWRRGGSDLPPGAIEDSRPDALWSTFASIQLEEQLSRLQREKNEIQNRLEEDQEDMNELMKKHKAAVAQVPCPEAPPIPHTTDTVLGLLVSPWHSLFFWEVAVPVCPGTQCGVGGAGVGSYGGSRFSTLSFPRLPGTWLR